MPTYEYTCKACGEHLEAVQSFHDAPLTTCPSCGGELRKVFGNVGIVFKGSGFYKTDSRASGSGKSSGDKVAVEPAKSGATSEPAKSEPGSATPASGGSSSSSDGGSSSGGSSGDGGTSSSPTTSTSKVASGS